MGRGLQTFRRYFEHSVMSRKKGKKDLKMVGQIENEEIVALQKKTSLTAAEIKEQHQVFKKMCPKGLMTKKQFLDNSSELLGEEGSFMAERLFNVFDDDKNGTMDFGEFILATNCTSLSDPQAKVSWIFDVFDEDGGGTIEIDEVINLVIGLFTMGGQEVEQEVVLACVKDIIDTLDEDGDGNITKDEFVRNATKSDFISSLVTD